MHDHINFIRDIMAQLKALESNLSYFFQVHYIFVTLHHSYAIFEISYNTHKDK